MRWTVKRRVGRTWNQVRGAGAAALSRVYLLVVACQPDRRSFLPEGYGPVRAVIRQ